MVRAAERFVIGFDDAGPGSQSEPEWESEAELA